MCKHKRGCIYNVVQGIIKSIMLGYGIKYGINILLGLLKPSKLIENVLSVETLINSSRFAAFLVLFNSLYKIVLCTMRRFTKNDKISSIIAGGE